MKTRHYLFKIYHLSKKQDYVWIQFWVLEKDYRSTCLRRCSPKGIAKLSTYRLTHHNYFLWKINACDDYNVKINPYLDNLKTCSQTYPCDPYDLRRISCHSKNHSQLFGAKTTTASRSLDRFNCKKHDSLYTVLQKYAQIGLKQNLLRSTTLDIITRLLDNAAFVCVRVVGRFSEDFSEVRVEKSRVSASGWMDDNITVRGIMERSGKFGQSATKWFRSSTLVVQMKQKAPSAKYTNCLFDMLFEVIF